MYNHIALIIGHLVGDYVLQNDWMACRKIDPKWEGAVACDVHCIVYSICITIAVLLSGWRVTVFTELQMIWSTMTAMMIAYVCHYPIDRIGLAAKWGKFFGQTNLMTHLQSKEFPVEGQPTRTTTLWRIKSPRAFFAAPVYIVVDNTFHLVLMWLLFSLCGEIVI